MGDPPTGIPAIAWFEPAQADLVRELAHAAHLAIVASGSPPAVGRAAGASGFAGAAPVTDLRLALATGGVEAALLAASPSSAEAPLADPDLLRLARSKGVRVLSLEPIPATVADARAADPSHWRETAAFIGLFRECPALATVGEVLTEFGPPRTVSISFRSGRGEGSLGARLFDAMHTLHSFLGAPESIDASIVTQVSASGLRLEPAESLRALHGDLTANLRFAGAKSAALTLSDRGGRWFRGVTLVGESGCVRLDETGLERIAENGTIIEEAPAKGKKRAPRAATVTLPPLVEGARRAMDVHAPSPWPIDLEVVLAMCEAAVLSARTGQPESPGTVLRMA